MVVSRRIDIDGLYPYQIGDVIKFELNDGQKVEAIAVMKELDGMVFLSKDCLNNKYAMNSDDICDDYASSDLRINLNNEILSLFPKEIIDSMVGFQEYGNDLLRIPTETEIFGGTINAIYKETENHKKFECVNDERDRIAYAEEESCQYWLQNTSGTHTSCIIDCFGDLDTDYVDSLNNVRLVFKLQNDQEV